MNSGIDREHMDESVRPQDDLFGHVNGGWLATAEIPADRGRYGAFDMLREKAEADVREVIQQAAAGEPPLDLPEGKVGALFASFMDTDRIAHAGLAPLRGELEAIASVQDASDVVATSARHTRLGVDGLLHWW